ncbi:hypothetical protein DB347_10220 [Opitutaceae bacterium EW11]|nr:hypothetical protein DB347_10220 [Opitutaceae bacterium EW11]
MKKPSLKKRFALPVVVAVSVHAALLFGFTNRKPVTDPPPTKTDWILVKNFPPISEDELKPPPEGEPGALPKLKSATGLPSIPDLPMPTDAPPPFSMEPTRINPGPVDPGVKSIPLGDPSGWNRTGTGSGHIISSEYLDNVPRVRLQVSPEYPATMRHEGRSGEVLVEFVVDESGRVINARILRTSHHDFEGPVLRAVARWRFDSGKRNGVPVKFRMVAPLNFNLGD